MTVVSIFTCYTTGSGELMDSAAEGVSGALASCIRLLFAISLSDYSLHQNKAYRFGVNLF